jgi:hypothetical protein
MKTGSDKLLTFSYPLLGYVDFIKGLEDKQKLEVQRWWHLIQ